MASLNIIELVWCPSPSLGEQSRAQHTAAPLGNRLNLHLLEHPSERDSPHPQHRPYAVAEQVSVRQQVSVRSSRRSRPSGAVSTRVPTLCDNRRRAFRAPLRALAARWSRTERAACASRLCRPICTRPTRVSDRVSLTHSLPLCLPVTACPRRAGDRVVGSDREVGDRRTL